MLRRNGAHAGCHGIVWINLKWQRLHLYNSTDEATLKSRTYYANWLDFASYICTLYTTHSGWPALCPSLVGRHLEEVAVRTLANQDGRRMFQLATPGSSQSWWPDSKFWRKFLHASECCRCWQYSSQLPRTYRLWGRIWVRSSHGLV